jgi:hypothetical protein
VWRMGAVGILAAIARAVVVVCVGAPRLALVGGHMRLRAPRLWLIMQLPAVYEWSMLSPLIRHKMMGARRAERQSQNPSPRMKKN